MALDTRDKRASAVGWGLAALLVLPAPDSTVDQGDRQHTAATYRGISATTGQTLSASANVVTVSAPTATLSSGAVTLTATAQVITVSAPTATLVPGAVTLTATANVVTVSAPTATLVAESGTQTLTATAQVVTVSAPTATLVPGAVTLTATANVVTVTAGTATLQGGLDAADDLHTWTVEAAANWTIDAQDTEWKAGL